MKCISEEAQNSNIVHAILNSSQKPGHGFVTSFCPRDFVQIASKSLKLPLWVMAALEPYYFEPNSKMISLKIVK